MYLGAVVIMASVITQALTTAKALRQATGVPARTSRRWLSWWRGAFLLTDVFVNLRARRIGVVAEKLPASIVSRLGDTVESQVRGLLHGLMPLTTGSGNGSRLLRDIA